MIQRHSEGKWADVPLDRYKDEPGTWVDVGRQVLFDSENSGFQGRSFRLGPNGYTSFEKHGHEHFVVVLSGSGRVRLGDEWYDLTALDNVNVAPWQPHQFVAGQDGMTILCVVDRERDRPVLLGNDPDAESS